ncbi:hypothetical protein BVX98_05245 [bacterium F11]|nr:hypothetical protein BVX98_05245 [bacterium F11]
MGFRTLPIWGVCAVILIILNGCHLSQNQTKASHPFDVISITHLGIVDDLESVPKIQRKLSPKYQSVRLWHPKKHPTHATHTLTMGDIILKFRLLDAVEDHPRESNAKPRTVCSWDHSHCEDIIGHTAIMEINGKKVEMVREQVFEVRLANGFKFIISAVDIEDENSSSATDIIIFNYK